MITLQREYIAAMMMERPQDRWLQPDSAAQFRAYSRQRMKNSWRRVVWSGCLLLLFGAPAIARLAEAEKNDQTWVLVAVAGVSLLRFGYYLYRLIEAKRELAEIQRSLGQQV